MSDKLKKILLFSGLIIITLLLAFALYYLFKKTGPLREIIDETGVTTSTTGLFPESGDRVVTTTPTEPGEVVPYFPQAGEIPSVESSYYRPTDPTNKITNSIASYNSINNNSGDLRFYDEADGKFYQINNNNVEPLSEKAFYNVEKVTWANSANKAVLEFPDSSKIIYNFENEKQVTLPKHWEDFSFSPDSTEIAAKSLGFSPENRWLVVTNDDNTETKIIEALGDNQDKVIVDWSPSRQAVAFTMTGVQPLGLYRKEVLLVGLNGENFKSLIVEGLGFTSKWSPTGKQLLYSVYSQNSDLKPEVWIANSYGNEIGANRRNLEINTWPEKCAFANETTLYCAIPQEMPTGAGIMPEVANGLTDEVYKIDLTTNFKTKVNTGDTGYSIKNLNYDSVNNRLMFSDFYESGIYEVKL